MKNLSEIPLEIVYRYVMKNIDILAGEIYTNILRKCDISPYKNLSIYNDIEDLSRKGLLNKFYKLFKNEIENNNLPKVSR